MGDFESLTIVSRRDETPELTLLTLRGASAGWRRAYSTPGQYAEVRIPGTEEARPMVLASAPGSQDVELLIKRGSRFPDAVVALDEGAVLELGPPAGKGFPVAEAAGKDLWLIGVGSGIAALRPVLAGQVGDESAPAGVTLLYGIRDADSIPFAGEIEEWRRAGCHVTIAVSGSTEGWSGPCGHVQDVLPTLTSDLSDAVVFACGMAEMIRELRDTAAKLGLDPARVFTNY